MGIEGCFYNALITGTAAIDLSNGDSVELTESKV
jgi:hypothetical protein